MIKFSEMYKPITYGPLRIDYFNILRGENEYRQIKRAQAYLYKKDLLKTVDEKGEKRLVLTTKAHRIFYEEYPLSALRKEKWNGYWTEVIYDFPERKRTLRTRLRAKLIDLGFGCPQESVLISPLSLETPVRRLVEGEELEEFVWILSAQRVVGLSNKEVARRAWHLDQTNELYRKLLDILPRLNKNNKTLLFEWQRLFLAVNAVDPYLPFELLPEDWLGEVCKKKFISLNDVTGLLKAIFKKT